MSDDKLPIIRNALKEMVTGKVFEDIPRNEVVPHDMPNIDIRNNIIALEELIRSRNLHDEPDPADHFFAPGVYCRQLFIPADQFIIGKLHKFGHINIISMGVINVVTEFGVAVYDATDYPVTFTSEPGTKRVVYAVEDTVWTCIHPTDETDLDAIEDEVIAKTYEELNLLE